MSVLPALRVCESATTGPAGVGGTVFDVEVGFEDFEAASDAVADFAAEGAEVEGLDAAKKR